MKKLLLSIWMLVVAIAAGAQDEAWTTDTIQGDELKGIMPDIAHCYVKNDMGMFIFWEGKADRFAIVSPKDMFDVTVSNGDTGALSIIGIYDDADNLKEKMYVWLILEQSSQYHRLFAIADFKNPLFKGHKKNIKKILDTVQSGSGYVRICAGRHQAEDFDLKVPPIKR